MTLPALPLVVADDLSGAAEAAVAFGPGTRVALGVPGRSGAEDSVVTVLDLETRPLAPEAAAEVTRAALGEPRPPLVVKKIDSQLRGPIAAEVRAARAPGVTTVVAPALPALSRPTRGGVVHVDGVPLHETDAWRVESRPAPRSIVEALETPDAALLTLDAVRARPADLAAAIAAHRGGVVICDAETEADLERIVEASLGVTPVLLVGSAALCHAVAARVPRGEASGGSEGDRQARPCLTIVGTAAPTAAEQAERLASETNPTRVVLPAADLLEASGALLDAWAARVADGLARGDVLVTLHAAPDGVRLPGEALTERLGALAGAALARPGAGTGPEADLILTGGETAHAVLRRLGVAELVVEREVHAGAVLSRASGERLPGWPRVGRVATRPGSFGAPESLLQIRRALAGAEQPDDHQPSDPQPPADQPTAGQPTADEPTPSTTDPTLVQPAQGGIMSDTPTTTLPVIAVTMGDGAGVGPEVTVAALLDDEVTTRCLPVVIGDAARLRQAAKILGLDADIVAIDSVDDAVAEPGRVNVIDLGLLPEDLPWGQLSAVAGDAAYQYIKVAAELAVEGKVQAICTAPLNKEALHMGGHNFPGHTELLAHLTGTPEVSMMLSSPKLRVIHVTTHIGLIDAIKKIEPGLVERVVRRGYDALNRAGIENPRIGVCAINPHAGEGGLFGYGEEEEKIIPALEKLRADGINAEGPLPADTAFYLGGRGDYDLIVAMYHDQGHGPVKVLGIEAGVNITVGLPVIRTSVDHGTAFDIAGKGIVNPESMVEAMRQAVNLAAVR